MSKELTTWEKRLADDAKDVAKLEQPTTTKISLRNGILSIDDQPLEGNKMMCVIVGALHEQVKYNEAWSPDKVIPPACYALHAEPAAKGAMAPDDNVPVPLNEDCNTCQLRQFGKNREKPECQSRRRIAVVAWNSDNTLADDIYTMSFPQYSSGKQFSAYANEVSLREQRPPWGVITEVSAMPHPKWQFLVQYETKGLVPDDVMGAVYVKVDAAQAALSMPYDMTIKDEAIPSVKGTN